MTPRHSGPNALAPLLLAIGVLAAGASWRPAVADPGYAVLDAAAAKTLPDQHGVIGITMKASTSWVLPDGTKIVVPEILSLTSSGPAQSAGLQKGDIVFAINGKAFTALSSVTAYIHSLPPGSEARVDYMRGDNRNDPRSVTVTIGSTAAAPAAPASAGERVATKTANGHTVELLRLGDGNFAARVDGRLVLTDHGDDLVSLGDTYRGDGRTYLLVGEASGGTACPSLYQVIDLTERIPKVSPRFGNCSDLPRAAVRAGVLQLVFPQSGSAAPRSETFGPGVVVDGSDGSIATVQPWDAAERFVRALYAPYAGEPGQGATLERRAPDIFDPELLALFRRDRPPPGEAGKLDFDPICQCQDWDDLRVLEVGISLQGPGKATATASILNGETRAEHHYELVLVGRKWRIHDIVLENSRTLRGLLQPELPGRPQRR